MLKSKEASSASKARLYLIRHKQNAIISAEIAQRPHKFNRGREITTLTQDWFQDNRGSFLRRRLPFNQQVALLHTESGRFFIRPAIIVAIGKGSNKNSSW